MDDFEVKLTLLSDMLRKKQEILEQILTITENQKSVFVRESETEADDLAMLRDMLRQMNDEKQKLIDEHLNSDRLFQNVFAEISSEFESRAFDYKPIIEGMQAMIKEIVGLDALIRVQEEKNRRVFETEISKLKTSKEVDFTKASKEYILKQYEKNNDRKKEENP